MKLLTYNFLTSKCIRGVKVGHPLLLNVVEKKLVTSEFNQDFITRMLPRIEWKALKSAADMLECGQDLPEEIDETFNSNTEFLQKVHHVLLEIDIVEGHLTCPETGRIFPINQGIPNMLLNEDEV